MKATRVPSGDIDRLGEFGVAIFTPTGMFSSNRTTRGLDDTARREAICVTRSASASSATVAQGMTRANRAVGRDA